MGVILASIVGLGVVVLGILVFMIAYPNPFKVFRRYPSPQSFGLDVHADRFTSGEAAWWVHHPDSEDVVLVCHGRSRGKAYMLPLVRELAKERHVCVFDFPSHGENPYGRTSIGWFESKAVGRALEYVESKGFRRIVVYGVSMGGAAATLALARDTPAGFLGLVTDGTYASLGELLAASGRRLGPLRIFTNLAVWLAGRLVGYDPNTVDIAAVLEKVGVPTLVLHGDRDPLVGRRHAERPRGVERSGHSGVVLRRP